MHILVISSWYPTKEQPFLGNFVEQQVQLLAEKHKLTLITFSKGDKARVDVSTSGNLTIHRIETARNSSKFQNYRVQKILFKKCLQDLEDVSLIHGHVIFNKITFMIKAKKFLQVPLIVTEHNSAYRSGKKWNWSQQLLFSKAKKQVDKLLVVSHSLREDIQKRGWNKPIAVIPNPIDTQRFHPPEKKENENTFLHISTLDPIKRVPEIIQAFAAAFAENNSLQLTIIADEDYSHLQKQIKGRPAENAITFLGPLSNEELVPYYQQAKAFLLFSEHETFSIVLAEAIACGTPIITTEVGLSKNLPPEVGKVIPHDKEALKTAILQIANNEIQFDKKKVVNFAQQFSKENFLQRLKDCFGLIFLKIIIM